MSVIQFPQQSIQPRGAASINARNPLSRKLVIAHVPSIPRLNLANRQQINTYNNTLLVDSPFGKGMNFSSSTNIGLRVNTATLLSGEAGNYVGGMSWAFLANPVASASAGDRRMCFSMAGGANENYIGFNFNRSLATTSGAFGMNIQVSAGGAHTLGVDGKFHLFVATIDAGALQPKMYVDGVDGTTNALNAASSTNASGNSDYIGGWSATGWAISGYHQALTLAWNRCLSPLEVRQISLNPWQVFEGPKRQLFDAAAAAGGASNAPRYFHRTQAGMS